MKCFTVDQAQVNEWNEKNDYEFDDNVVTRDYDENDDYDVADFAASQSNTDFGREVVEQNDSLQNNDFETVQYHDESNDYDLEAVDGLHPTDYEEEAFDHFHDESKDYDMEDSELSQKNFDEDYAPHDESMDYDMEDSTEPNSKSAAENVTKSSGKGVEMV